MFLNVDTNGDGFFDEQELEALFTKEVNPQLRNAEVFLSLVLHLFAPSYDFSCWFYTVCPHLWFQLEKIYDPTNEEDDMVEMEEERLRMREHVMNEVQLVKLRATANLIWAFILFI